MSGIQFNIKAKRFCTLLVAFVCVPFFSFFSNIDNLDSQEPNIDQEAASDYEDMQRAMIPKAQKNFRTDIFIQDADFYQTTRRLSNEQKLSSLKNTCCMTTFLRLPYSFLFLILSCFIARFGCIICKFKRRLVIPYSTHAPPVFSCRIAYSCV